MTSKMFIAIDPGNVTGVAIAHAGPDGGPVHAPTTYEIAGGLPGFIEFMTVFPWCLFDHVFLEDFIIDAKTHLKTAEPAVWLLVGYVQGKCIEAEIPLRKFGASGHKKFNGKGRASKARRLGWAEVTKDGHGEDACSLLLSGLDAEYPALVADHLKGLLDGR